MARVRFQLSAAHDFDRMIEQLWDLRKWAAYILQKMVETLIRTYGASKTDHILYSVDRQEDYFHPYSFIGIPGISNIDGTSFESLRSNQAYYKYDPFTNNNIPTSDLKVLLIRDIQRLFYFPSMIRAYKHNS